MILFLKTQLSSLVATVTDFAITILLVELVDFSYLTATITGAISGAITNFTINKYWSFNQRETKLKTQGIKYIIVWVGSISLNALGSNCLVKFFMLPYLISKIIISIIVGVFFNYQLQKHYVFKKSN